MQFFRALIWRLIKAGISRMSASARQKVIRESLAIERNTPPQEAARWLLEIYDEVGVEIDQVCIRWGNGVHIKHELMDGIHAFFYKRVPENSKVLDLGCGIGAVADSIAQYAQSSVLGMDFNAEAIAFARQHYQHPRLRFLVGNVFTDLPEGDAFDIIVLSSVLEHLEGRPEFLRNLLQQFHPKKFLIRVPTFEQHYFKALKRELGLYAYVDPTHVLEYSTEIFKSEMSQAKLRIEYLEIRWGDIWAECVPECVPE